MTDPELRRLTELANDLPGGSDWLYGEVSDGTETVAEWMGKCSANPDAPAAGLLHVVWSEGSDEKTVEVQAIVGDTETAPIRAAFMANANPAAVLALLDERDELAATVDRLRDVHARYFDMDGRPGYDDDTNPEPEDVWRYDRDFRAALTEEQA